MTINPLALLRHAGLPAAAVGAFMGIFVVKPGADYWAYHAGPVVQMKGELVSLSPQGNEAVISLRGEKLKPCTFISIRAQAKRAGEPPLDANLDRVGVHPTGATKPLGLFDLGLWRVYRQDSLFDGVRLYTTHSCLDEMETTVVADIDFPNKKPTK